MNGSYYQRQPWHDPYDTLDYLSSPMSTLIRPPPPVSIEPQRGRPPAAVNYNTTMASPSGPSPAMSDPSNDKMCPICTEMSEHPHQIHYGGLGCFSCRAFFRRAHQKTRSPKFVCKKGNVCVISLKNRRRCQKCRYDLCLKSGMRPEAVLTVDQKKVRFRNMLRKKNARRSEATISRETVDDDDSDDDDEDYEDEPVPVAAAAPVGASASTSDSGLDMSPMVLPPTIAEDVIVIEPSSSNSSASSSISNLEEEDEPQVKRARTDTGSSTSASSNSSGEMEPLVKLEVEDDEVEGWFGAGPYSFSFRNAGEVPSEKGRRQVEKVLHCFSLTCSQMEIEQGFVQQLLNFHLGDGLLAKGALKRHISSLGNQFRHFAILHKDFLRLSKSDQRKLLLRNTPLYIQYLLARYFTAADGLSQITWLLSPQHTPDLKPCESRGIQRVSFNRFNKMIHLFRKDAMLDMYKEFASRLNKVYFKYTCNAILAHIFLFSHDKTNMFDRPDLVQEFHRDCLDICPHSRHYYGCIEKPNVGSVIATCEAMARFFAQNMLWRGDGDSEDDMARKQLEEDDYESHSSPEACPEHGLVMPYTQEEESWLQNQLDTFKRAYSTVALGEDILKEFVMFAYDVPVSKHFMPEALSVFGERFRRVMKSHVEFQVLSDAKQEEMWAMNSLYGVALNIAMLEGIGTGAQQLQFSCGELDDHIWRKEFSEVIDNVKLKKMTMMAANKVTGILPEDLMTHFGRLVQNIGSMICKDVDTFKLVTLITLFSETHSNSTGPIRDLRLKYSKILKRRQRSIMPSGSLADCERDYEENVAFGNALYSRFNSCVCDVKELAMIVKKIHL